MTYALKQNGVWTEIVGAFTANDTQYPPNYAELATDKERAALGIREMAYDYSIPAGSRFVRADIVDRNGVPTMVWVSEPIPATEARDLIWQDIKRRRTDAIGRGAKTPFGVFDADDASRINLAGAVQMAQIAKAKNEAFAVDWTLHDNSTVRLDADKMIAAGVTVGAFVGAVYAKAQGLRAKLDDLVAKGADAAKLYGLDIASGWDVAAPQTTASANGTTASANVTVAK